MTNYVVVKKKKKIVGVACFPMSQTIFYFSKHFKFVIITINATP